ncbi:hypothetical protein ACJMK2_043128 [Sinanodonta woodiana]|uniref:Integrase catalytic domain-containing protein n=1 Tax=Sinanodonta woodiana TaxID=1069815 RepID=A0ABD3VXP5_SINWO
MLLLKLVANYLELRKGLIDRFGKRPHEHFATLVSLTRESTETYRGLMARIDQHIKRFLDDRDPVICFCEDFFLKALPQEQAQWIRRNKGFSPIVEAAEDCIPANVHHRWQKDETHPSKSGKNNNMNIHNTQQQAKLTSTSDQLCPTDDMNHRSNPATCFVKPSIGQRLISETGYVNGREIMFVMDTGSDMTLIREDLVDKKCKLEGHKVTLYTAVDQPFTAQLAVVNIETNYYKGPAQVGLVSNLAAEALMGMDILGKKGSFIVTRSMSKGLDNERTVECTNQCEDDGKKEVVNHSIETADTDHRENIEMGKLSSMNADMLSKLQLAYISLQGNKEKSFASREEAEEEPMPFFWENDILRRKWQSGDGPRLRKMVMELAHDRPLAGHLGLEKTKEMILESFFWPGVFSDVKKYCISCHECQMTAKRTAGEKAPMVCPPVITELFSKIAMDIVGPLARTKSGHKYILTVVNDATRYTEAFPLKDIEATSVARALVELFSRVGFPRVILTYKGTNFTSTLLKLSYELTLKSMLRKFCTDNKNEWDEMLPFLLFTYREVPHEETGFAPIEMLYGWPVRGPMQILKGLFMGEENVRKSTVEHVVKMRETLADIGALVKESLLDRQKKIKALYDRDTRTREFNPGDEVLIILPSSSSKMKAQWQGPYRVVRKINDVNYQVSVPGRRGTVTYHVNLLRKYKRAVLMTTQGYDNDGVDVDYHPRTGEGDAGVKLGVNLSKEQREDIISLCDEFQDVLTTRPGRTNILTHSIKTTSETPIKQWPYRIPFAQQQEVKSILDEMLEQGLIRPSLSPWSSPCVFVDKKDGTLRLCADYRKLNDITLFDAYPVPRMDDLFEKIGYGRYLIPLAEESLQKSAFVTPFGLYEFNAMPFGMKTAPASFARLIDILVTGLHNVAAYFDNIIVSSTTWSEHIENLRALLQRIREDGLTIKPSKCEFGAAEIDCLGHIIGVGKIKTDDNKIKAMYEFPLPTTIKGIRSFLGMVGYYRKSIKNFAEVAVPLTSMTQKGRQNILVWTEDVVRSFKVLKDALAKAPVHENADGLSRR